MESRKILIFNETIDGIHFRPSDWAERLANCCASFSRNKRLQWHNLIRPVYIENRKCLVIDSMLKISEPYAWDYVIGFVTSNKLKISQNYLEFESELGEKSSSIAA